MIVLLAEIARMWEVSVISLMYQNTGSYESLSAIAFVLSWVCASVFFVCDCYWCFSINVMRECLIGHCAVENTSLKLLYLSADFVSNNYSDFNVQLTTTYYTISGHCSCRPANIRFSFKGVFKWHVSVLSVVVDHKERKKYLNKCRP
jgi:hypothetical protein